MKVIALILLQMIDASAMMEDLEGLGNSSEIDANGQLSCKLCDIDVLQ